jgi:predicted GH43/DUF377 family glycosyl hydrolase
MKRPSVAGIACLCLTGCSHYGAFTLPPANPRGPAPSSWTWQAHAGALLEPGAPGQWDSTDVLNPSVIRRGGLYWNYYSGFDGATWHTGLATSPDGLAWQKQGKVLSPREGTWESPYIAANGSALPVGNAVFYWYQAGARGATRIGLARSSDGRSFTAEDQPVLNPGPRGSWDEVALGDPYIIESGGRYWMFYLGQDRARRQRLGLAQSGDGVHWTKLLSNPILELGEAGAFDENGLGEPAVWQTGGLYWMAYTGRDVKEHRRIGLAKSVAGVHWQRVPGIFSGGEPWNSTVVCDPSVDAASGEVRVWYGGGDAPSPDENLHGRIGLAVLKPN